MTDKQIIIDGIDVSGCLFYQTNFEEDYDVKIKHYCSNWHNSCQSNNNSNCYYKQLLRKEQECERLRFPMPDTNYAILTKEEFKNFNQLKKENEDLKRQLESTKGLVTVGNKQLAEALKENEELKKQLMQKSEVDMFFNTPIEGWSNDPCGICKYKQTLAEIKEIAEDTKDKFYDAIHTGGLYERLEQIIKKINEVKDDNTRNI